MNSSPAIGFWVAAKVRRIGRNCNRNLSGLSEPDQRPARSVRALYAPVLAQLDPSRIERVKMVRVDCCRSPIRGARDGCEFNAPPRATTPRSLCRLPLRGGAWERGCDRQSGQAGSAADGSSSAGATQAALGVGKEPASQVSGSSWMTTMTTRRLRCLMTVRQYVEACQVTRCIFFQLEFSSRGGAPAPAEILA
jgi:hypothetical protein